MNEQGSKLKYIHLNTHSYTVCKRRGWQMEMYSYKEDNNNKNNNNVYISDQMDAEIKNQR